jgi:hypothetical protein
MTRFRLSLLLVCLIAASPLAAQPFSAWLIKQSSPGFVEIPHSSAFDFTTGFTLEAWVNGTDPGGCSGIAGKGYTSTWWIGVCGTTLRSYIQGTSSLFDGGKVAANDWVHIAVTYDGTTRKHYIDGELVASHANSGPMTTNTSPVRIDSDVNYNFSYGNIDEVRIWNVARTRDELRANINVSINAAQPGLVAVYHLDGSGTDSVGGHNGSLTNAAFLTAPVALTCGSTTSTALCASGARFSVTSKWQVTDTNTGIGHVVPGSSADSGNFWFFGPDNWELLVKVLDGCPVNGHKWVFSAATTDQHYSLIVTDVKSGQTRRYFNYSGNAAPAITDTSAFATCP